jgi:tripartite-type tricarboxylate transporter receptor subunit TctC
VLADTPTVAEAGVPGYSLYPWLAVFVPAKTPSDIVGRINTEIARVLSSAEVKARLVPQGMDLATGSPEDLAALIRQEHASWGKVVRDAGIKGE